MFDFRPEHKPGKTVTMPDGLSQRLPLPANEEWAPPVAFNEMTEPIQSVNHSQEPRSFKSISAQSLV